MAETRIYGTPILLGELDAVPGQGHPFLADAEEAADPDHDRVDPTVIGHDKVRHLADRVLAVAHVDTEQALGADLVLRLFRDRLRRRRAGGGPADGASAGRQRRVPGAAGGTGSACCARAGKLAKPSTAVETSNMRLMALPPEVSSP